MDADIQRKKLEEQGYELHSVFEYPDLRQKLPVWLALKTPPARAYNFLMYGFFLIVGGVIGYLISTGDFRLVYLFQFALGMAALLLLIPVHEWLHGVAYRISGAKNITYKAYWGSFIFYAVADGFPADYRTFRFCALFPFAVLGIILIISLFGVPELWRAFTLGMLVMHFLSCIGDFGMLSFMSSIRDREVVTLDESEKEISYFYVKPE